MGDKPKELVTLIGGPQDGGTMEVQQNASKVHVPVTRNDRPYIAVYVRRAGKRYAYVRTEPCK